MLTSIQNEREWARFCEVILGEPDLPEQPGFRDNTARVANRPAVDARVAATLGLLARDQAAERFTAAGTANGLVHGVADLGSDPALRRVDVETSGGMVSATAPPAIPDGATPQIGPVPAIGEHSEAIWRDFA